VPARPPAWTRWAATKPARGLRHAQAGSFATARYPPLDAES
jgi:hypothetical protein